jgi:DNA invertase Pin-like site-specific DNA recombinase
MTSKPRAYSYIGLSAPEPAKGDGLTRLRARAAAWAETHNLDLDRELTFPNPGVSAYRRKNAAAGGVLTTFLSAVEDGRVPRGSYLVLERLDRISRQAVRRVARTLEDICEAGINVVDLEDGGRVHSIDTLDTDQCALIMMVIRFQRASAESVIKGQRVRAAYDSKRELAREQPSLPLGCPRIPFTTLLPGWLRWDDATGCVALIEDRAEVVRGIFEAAKGGMGQHAIAHDLNKRKVPVFGKAEHWHRSYIAKILRNRSVLGEFHPHLRETQNGKRKPLDPIPGYFPAVIGPETWTAVQARLATTQARGRHANRGIPHLFVGLLRCALCGGGMTQFRSEEFVCARANSRAACKRLPVKVDDVQAAFLKQLPRILKEVPRGPDTADLEGQAHDLAVAVVALQTDERELIQELLESPSQCKAALRDRLAIRGSEKERLEDELRRVRERLQASTPVYVAGRIGAINETLRDLKKHAKSAAEEGNKALRAALSRIDLDPRRGALTLHWHHADDTQEIQFPSKWNAAK